MPEMLIRYGRLSTRQDTGSSCSSLREVGGVRKTPKRLSTLLGRGTDLLEGAHNVQTRIG